jgi:hypothetical protein
VSSAAASVVPTHAALSRIVARNLGMTPAQLAADLGPARRDDFDDVLAFRRAHLHVTPRWHDAAHLRWRYHFGDAAAGFGDLQVLRRHGEVIAILGLENLACVVDSARIDGVRGMDLLVRRDVHESGLGTWLNQWMVEQYPFVLAMGANAQSIGIVRRLFQPLPPRLTFTHPIDIAPFAARRWPHMTGVVSAVAPIANAAIALRDSLAQSGRSRGLEVQPVDRFTDAMLPKPAVATVQVLRTAAHLNRRLLDNPRRPCHAALVRRDGRPAGYMAWADTQDAAGNPELRVADWQCDRPPVFTALLDAAVAEARARHCSCVRVVLQDAREQQLAGAAGFASSARDEGRVVGVQSGDAELAARLARARWALTDATDDADGF